MHIGLNLVFLTPGEQGGMETYARELIPALLAERPGLQVTAFINREGERVGGPWSELVPSVTVPVDARNRVEWVRGEQQLLPPAAKRAGVELVHSLGSTAPVWGGFRRVTTIHDLIYLRFPEAHFGLRTLGMRLLVPAGARRSHRVIADSESTRRDLLELIKLDAGKVDVVPLGLGAHVPDAVTPEAELRARLELGDRRVLYTNAAKRPHKNLMRLFDAVAGLPEPRPVLVMTGYETPYEAELRARITELGLDGDVRMLGWVSLADVEGIYRLADAFVFPSLYEGFGLPVLEAMARGVPVACADRSSLPEVAGDAALLFDPEDVGAMSSAITRLLDDGALRDRLREAGRAQAARFTWAETARRTLASYDRALAA